MKKHEITICVKINEYQSEVIKRTILTDKPYVLLWSATSGSMIRIGDMLVRSENIVYAEWKEV